MIEKTQKLKIDVYDQAHAVKGGQEIVYVYDKNGDYVPNTGKRKYGKGKYGVPDLKISVSEIEEYFDEEVVYIGFMRGHWGHFMVDSSVRLWALDQPECQNKRILVSIEGMELFYQKLFDLLGVNKSRILIIHKPVRFRRIYVPELSYLPEHFIAREYLNPFERIKNRITLDKPVYDKIYLSRVHFAKGKRELGEKEVQNLFECNGYKVLYPEELSFEEQVWYYKNCNSIVTTNGTIAHNVLYAGDGIELIILNRFLSEENIHQKAINSLKKMNIHYIDAYEKSSKREISLMKVTRQLIDFCTQKNFIIPQGSIFCKVVQKCIFTIAIFRKGLVKE